MSGASHAEVEKQAEEISFFVAGTPVPKGSMRSLINPKTMRAVTFGVKKDIRVWQDTVSTLVYSVAPAHPWPGPIGLQAIFHVPRKANHFRKNGTLKPNAPTWCFVRPDGDKYLRCLKDALSRIVYIDDGQVALTDLRKIYSSTPGVAVRVWRLEP